MVGRLVKQQHIGLGQEQAAKRHATALATRKLCDVGVARRAAQRVHRDLDRALHVPAVGCLDLVLQVALLDDQGVHLVVFERLAEPAADLVEAIEQRLGFTDAFEHVPHDVLGRVELRLLRQEADLDAVGGPRFAAVIVIEPRHQPQQGRLAGAVRPQHTDLGSRQEGEPDVLEHLLAAGIGLGQAFHDVDVLVGRHRFFGLAGAEWGSDAGRGQTATASRTVYVIKPAICTASLSRRLSVRRGRLRSGRPPGFEVSVAGGPPYAATKRRRREKQHAPKAPLHRLFPRSSPGPSAPARPAGSCPHSCGRARTVHCCG